MSRLLILVLAAGTLAACGSPAPDLAGTWIGTVKAHASAAELHTDEENLQLIESQKPVLVLKKDHTFVLGGGEGTWSADGKTLSLTTTRAMGFAKDDPRRPKYIPDRLFRTLKMRIDGAKLVNGGEGKIEQVFTRT